MILNTENITLRPWSEADAGVLYDLAKNPNIGPNAGWTPPQSIEDSLNTIKNVYSRGETYAIIYDGKIVGCIGLIFYPEFRNDWGKDAAQIGYWIGEEYQNKGICTKAAKLVVQRAFKDLYIKAIYGTFYINNVKSKRVLEKLGFKYHMDFETLNYKKEKCIAQAMVLTNDNKK